VAAKPIKAVPEALPLVTLAAYLVEMGMKMAA
jgi:hypothetical protein